MVGVYISNSEVQNIDNHIRQIKNAIDKNNKLQEDRNKYLEKIAAELSFMNIEKKIKLEAMGNLKEI